MKAERVYLFAVTAVLSVWTFGCREPNPAYVPRDGSLPGVDADDGSRTDAPRDGRLKDGTVVVGPDATDSVRETGGNDGPMVLVDTPPADARDAKRDGRDAGLDGPMDQAQIDPDGAPPVDGQDDVPAGDGPPLGVDAAPACEESAIRVCSSRGNPLIGACHTGTQTCVGGVWSSCSGEGTPANETCNGVDDNCNGMVDEGCAADCVVVAPTGDDTSADGTTTHPFATITRAMNFAVSVDGGAPAKVCVAAGTTCSDRKTFALSGTLDMLDGARVQGNYALSGASLVYCGATPPTTVLQFPATGDGIVFGGSVQSGALGGFSLSRAVAANPTPGSMAAVVVKNGTVSLSALFIGDQSGVENTRGIAVEGGNVTLTGSSVGGGQGTASAMGVLVTGGTVNLRNNCSLDANGLCPSLCPAGTASQTTLGIRGRGASVGGGPSASNGLESSAVYAKGGTAIVVGNNLCGGAGNASETGAVLATVRCENGACGTIAANAIAITSNNAKQLATVSFAEGGGLVDSNLIVGGCASDFAAAVVLSNASARLQNNRVVGGACTGGGKVYGVRILLGAGAGEPDLNSNDIEPAGGGGDCQSFGVSIERVAGDSAAATILRNNIVSTGVCRKRYAVLEQGSASARIIENNDFYPSAAPSAAETTVLYSRAGGSANSQEQINALSGAANNLVGDPRYVLFPTDWHLAGNSPCIDRGTSAGAPTTDFAGTSRPQGAGFNIGAYELAKP